MLHRTPAPCTKTEAAFRALRRAIEDGRLHPGEHLRVRAPDRGSRDEPDPDPRGAAAAAGRGPRRSTTPIGAWPSPSTRPRTPPRSTGSALVLEPLAAELGGPAARRDEQLAELRRLHAELAAAIADDSQHRCRRAQRGLALRRYDASARATSTTSSARLWQALPGRAIWLTGPREHVLRAARARHGRDQRRDAAAAAACMREHIASGALRRSSTCARGLASATGAACVTHRRSTCAGWSTSPERAEVAALRATEALPGADRAAQPARRRTSPSTADQARGGRRGDGRRRAPAASRWARSTGSRSRVKDNIDVAGVPARVGSAFFADRVPGRRRRGRAAAARRRRRRPRQDRTARVRLRRDDPQPALRRLPQPVGPRPRARRLQRRLGRRARRRPVPRRARHGHGRLGPHPRGAQRRQRAAADLRAGLATAARSRSAPRSTRSGRWRGRSRTSPRCSR